METITDDTSSAAPYTGFAALVADQLEKAHIPAGYVPMVVEGIDGVHQVRVRMLEHQIKEEQRAALAYASMDRANAIVMQYAKQIVANLVEVNGRQAAFGDSMGHMRLKLVELVRQAESDQEATVPIAALRELADWQVPEPPLAAPLILGHAVDSRYSYGQFRQTYTHDTANFTFLGWSLVLHNPPIRTELEPTFLRRAGGEPATRLALSVDGWELVELH